MLVSETRTVKLSAVVKRINNTENKIIGPSKIMAAQDHEREGSFRARSQSIRRVQGAEYRMCLTDQHIKIRSAMSGHPTVGREY